MKIIEKREELPEENVYIVISWWKLTKLSKEDKNTILNGDIFEWHSEWQYEGNLSFYDSQMEKREMAMLYEIEQRPPWEYGEGIFVKRVNVFAMDDKLKQREVCLINKFSPEDKEETFAIIKDPLLLCLFDKEVAEEVYCTK